MLLHSVEGTFRPFTPAGDFAAPHKVINLPHPDSVELLVVMPVFNEQASISRVLDEWFPVLDRDVGNFILLAIDDGSTDGTHALLAQLRQRHGQRLEIMSHQNRGHGQSCMAGYRIALERNIPFILQIDSDGQSAPCHFHDFWRNRHEFDVIYGKRRRSDGLRRVLASAILKTLLKLLAKVDCADANVPYRLMHTKNCAAAIQSIPAEFYLANIALAVALRKMPGIRHGSVPIGFPPRLGGEPSVPFRKFAAKGRELFRQLSLLES